ncbi:hypothetical protein BT69DRAFT_1262631 [Atractiella rhizophila]|nr:hypothetical protein BT69DRAFT_1262631 [Atractiella rhizophila]
MSQADEQQKTIEKYQSSHASLDWEGMSSCLSPTYTFSDPAFPDLDERMSKGMWCMFLENRETNKMVVKCGPATKTGENTWEYDYSVDYVLNSRPILNHMHATLTLSPSTNLITKQVDHFDFYAWARQALGVSGYLLGWTEMVKGQVRTRAKGRLEGFLKKKEARATEGEGEAKL